MTVILAELTLPLASSNTVEPSSTRVALFSDREYPGADPRLIGDVSWRRASSSAIWSRQPAGSADISVELANADAGIDWLLTTPLRNAVLRVQWVDESDAVPVVTIATLYPTRLEAPDESRIVLVCTDILGRLSVPLTQATYGAGSPASLRDRPKPVALGFPLSVPIVLVDDIDYYYDAHDTASAVAVQRVRDAGAVLTPVAQWIDRTTGIELLQLPVATVVADLRAGATVDLTVVEMDFAFWALDPKDVVPDGWDYIVQGGGAVGAIDTPIYGLYLRIGSVGVGVDAAEILPDTMFAQGELALEVEIAADLFAAAVTVHWGSASHTISESGLHRFGLIHAGPDEPLIFRVTEDVTSAFPGAVITRIKITRREISGGQGRVDAVAQAAFARALPTSMFDATAWAAAASVASNPDVGFWSSSAPDVRAVITQLCDSTLLLPFGDAAGHLSARALDAPGTRAPAIAIEDWQIAGDVRVSPDRLENVPTAVVGGRNWHVYGDDELADILDPAERALLTAEHRFTASIAAMGAEVKRSARSQRRIDSDESIRDPTARSTVGYPTLLDTATACEAVATRLAALIPPGRVARWVEFDAFVSRADLVNAQPGQVISLTCARWGLVDQRCILVEVGGKAGSLRASWLLWTTLEATDE